MTHPLITYLSTHPKKTIIFDLDNTLIQLTINWSGVYDMLFDAAKKLYPDLKITMPLSSYEFYTLYSQLVVRGGLNTKEILDHTIETFEVSNYHGYIPNSTLLSFIHNNTNQYQFALWTSNTRGAIQDFLEKESLKNVFNTIVTLNDVFRAKPQPDGFLTIFNNSLSKKDYLMVGDRSIDRDAAHNAGIDYFQEEYFNSLTN